MRRRYHPLRADPRSAKRAAWAATAPVAPGSADLPFWRRPGFRFRAHADRIAPLLDDLRQGNWHGNPNATRTTGVSSIEVIGDRLFGLLLDLVWEMDNAVPAAADTPDTISSAPTVPKKQISCPRTLAVLASEDEIEEELGGLMDTDDLSNMNGLTEYDGDFDRFSEPRWKSWGAKGGRASAARVPTLQADSAEEPATSRYGGNNSSTSLGLPPLVGEAGIATLRRLMIENDAGEVLRLMGRSID